MLPSAGKLTLPGITIRQRPRVGWEQVPGWPIRSLRARPARSLSSPPGRSRKAARVVGPQMDPPDQGRWDWPMAAFARDRGRVTAPLRSTRSRSPGAERPKTGPGQARTPVRQTRPSTRRQPRPSSAARFEHAEEPCPVAGVQARDWAGLALDRGREPSAEVSIKAITV
jgi:hypothetical protein